MTYSKLKSVLIDFVYIPAQCSLETQFCVIRSVVERSNKSTHAEGC